MLFHPRSTKLSEQIFSSSVRPPLVRPFNPRNIHAMYKLIIILVLCMLGSLRANADTEPKPLSKAEATKILAGMGYENVNIAFIVQGILGTPGGATVVGMGMFKGQSPKRQLQKIEKQFLYDAALGWFYSEDGTVQLSGGNIVTGIRIWSTTGYSEVHAAPGK